MRKRQIVNPACRARSRQDSDLAAQLAPGLRYEAVHIGVGQRFAQFLHLILKRWRGPARRGDRRVILDALDDPSG